MDRAFQRIRSLMLRGTFYSVPPRVSSPVLHCTRRYIRALLYGCGRHSNASLTCFANAFYIVIGKPFDFGFEQCFFYVLELGLTDNNFNFFIVVFVFCI